MKNTLLILAFTEIVNNSSFYLILKNDSGRLPKFYVLIKGSANISNEKNNGGNSENGVVQELVKGMTFGDIPLISDSTKFDSVICQEECHFAVLAREASDKIMGTIIKSIFLNSTKAELTRRKLEEKTEQLMTFSIFKGVAKKALFPLIHHFIHEETPLNKVLYKEGDAPTSIYFILSGKFKAITTVSIPLIDEFENNLTLSPRFTKKSTGRTSEVFIFLTNIERSRLAFPVQEK